MIWEPGNQQETVDCQLALGDANRHYAKQLLTPGKSAKNTKRHGTESQQELEWYQQCVRGRQPSKECLASLENEELTSIIIADVTPHALQLLHRPQLPAPPPADPHRQPVPLQWGRRA